MVTVHYAKTNLSKLLKEVEEKGKEVTIARRNKPVATLGPVKDTKKKGPRVPGRWRGKIKIAADAFDPMTDEELKLWGYD